MHKKFAKVHFYEQIRHLCYGNACADFIPFWFVFLSKKEKKDVDISLEMIKREFYDNTPSAFIDVIEKL